jgi:16S rRNA (cytidine1402-2'-O)-methyltransferase
VTGPAGGALVLVATPIGNLGDLSPRAVDELARADVIAAEDTRRTRALLTHAGLKAGGRLRSLPAIAERQGAEWVVDRVRAGERVAYVTDAGMPGISDPGSRLVGACLDAGLTVEVVPGPSAVLAALVLSGLPTDRFVFEGFLPRRGPARRERIAAIATERRTVVVFEAPPRVRATVGDLLAACGPLRQIAIAREITKLHEDVWRGELAGAQAALGAEPRGEHVLVLAPAPELPEASDDEIDAHVRTALGEGLSARDAAARVALDLRVSRRRAYDAVMQRKRAPESGPSPTGQEIG